MSMENFEHWKWKQRTWHTKSDLHEISLSFVFRNFSFEKLFQNMPGCIVVFAVKYTSCLAAAVVLTHTGFDYSACAQIFMSSSVNL